MLVPESELETRIMADPRWIAGASWGEPRRGHPEGEVRLHVMDVLANLEGQRLSAGDRSKLRLVALIHDTFKNEVDRARPRSGENHHATIARRFAEKYVDDPEVLELIELHDEAYNSWVTGRWRGDWAAAEARAWRLIDRLGPSIDLYLAFYRADNATGDKEAAPLEWFERLVSTSRPR